MRRRELIALVGAAAIWPLGANAQPRTGLARIGFLGAETAASAGAQLKALREGLLDHGYAEGKNLILEMRFAEGAYERLPELTTELIRAHVDVIVSSGTKATLGAKRATSTVPIVMGSSGDIVALGLVSSLARPGGNITGSTNVGRELGAKRLDLLKELMPSLTRVAYLVNPHNPAFGPNLQVMWNAARSLHVELLPFEVKEPAKYDGVFQEIAQRDIRAVVIQDDTALVENAQAIAGRAIAHRLLAAGNRRMAQSGSLVGYGPDLLPRWRRAAYFVDRILKGAKPDELPIEQPTKFDLVINLATAKALGVSVPESLLARADEVIE